jgi:hypothetical protein
MQLVATTGPHFHDTLARNASAGAMITNNSAPLSAGRMARDTLLIMALLLINAAGTPGALAFFGILLVMLARSPQAAFKALAICSLGLMINQAFVPKTLVWTPGRLILPLLALVRFSADLSKIRFSLLSRPWYLALLVFAATMAICSMASGWYTQIALLKLFNFTAVITGIFAGTAVLRQRRIDISEWFVSLILAATLFGIGSVVLGVSKNFTQIAIAPGQILTELGFNGAFLHPNLHATYASLFVAFLAAVWILGRYRRTWLAVPVMACWFVFMAWSSSRTSFVASTIGILLLMAFAKPARNRFHWQLRPNVKRGTLLAIAGLALIGGFVWDLATGGSLSKPIVAFVNKAGAGGDSAASLNTEKILASRKLLLDMSWKNFAENPLFGIGFGVAKTLQFTQTATLFSAPAEKGFLPTAMLEEGGVLGTAAFLLFLATFIGTMVRERNIAGLVTFVTFLATNIGEVTIFAPGGAGFFGWITVGAAMILGDHCWGPPAPWSRNLSGRHDGQF